MLAVTKRSGGWTEVDMDTFLVQVWVPADDRSRGDVLRGLVRHVATGTETPFSGDEEILRLLHRTAGPSPHP